MVPQSKILLLNYISNNLVVKSNLSSNCFCVYRLETHLAHIPAP